MKTRATVWGLVMVGLIGISIGLHGIWGCGGSSTRAGTAETGSGIDIAATVTLPSSASGSLSALTTKSATTEAPASDLTVEVYDENDLLLGEGTTGSDGTVTIPDVDLAEGAHTLFIRTLDTGGAERVGAILEVTVTADTTTITKTVNSTEDLAYRSFLAACEEQLGAACAPGLNMISGIAKVTPACIRDAILDMAASTVSGDSVGGMFGALLQAHQSNMAVGNGVDMVAVMRGDATALSNFGSVTGEIASLTTKSAVASADAAATAATILDQVTSTLCNDPTAYATIRADTNYQSDPGVFANYFASIEPGDITSVNTTELKRLVVNAPAVGFAYSANPLGARAVMETMFSRGFEGVTDPTEMQKRYATIVGAGVPADADAARSFGAAARNIYAGTNFATATVGNAMSYFGPIFLGDAEQRKDCIVGGTKAFDNLIDRFGSLTAFANQYTASGNVDTFLAAYPQKGVGGTCTVLYDCGVPLSCRAGKCAGVSNLGIACTTSAQCDTANGAACEPELKMCVNAVGQGVDLAFVGYTPPTDGAAGGFCTTDAACPSNYKCLNGRCEPPGTGLGSEVCGDGRCNGAENYTNCTADCGAVSATYCGDGSCQTARLETTTTCPSDCSSTPTVTLTANGGSCTINSGCSSGYCGGPTATRVCKLSGTGAEQDVCDTAARCSSATCTSGFCAPAYPLTFSWTTAGGSNTCGNDTPTTLTQTSATAATVAILNQQNSTSGVTVSGSAVSFTWGMMTCVSAPFSTAALGPVTCTMSGNPVCAIHLIP